MVFTNLEKASIQRTREKHPFKTWSTTERSFIEDFLVYAYLQSGGESEAQKIIDEIKAMPPMPDMYGMDFDPRLSSQARSEASYALELHEWGKAASLSPASKDADYAPVTYLARAISAARSGQVAEARKDVEQVKSITKVLREKKDNHGVELVAFASHPHG